MDYASTKSKETIEDVPIDQLEFEHPTKEIQPEIARFPYCMVWTPIPLITWLIPWIGHLGIATSKGVIHDFAGSYFISVDDFAFGSPHKYVQLDISEDKRVEYDKAIRAADDKYREQMHNLICHVADALARMKYKQGKWHNMVTVWWMTITQSRYVSYMHVVWTYLPFLLLSGLVLSLILLTRK